MDGYKLPGGRWELNPGPSRAASALNCRVISPALRDRLFGTPYGTGARVIVCDKCVVRIEKVLMAETQKQTCRPTEESRMPGNKPT